MIIEACIATYLAIGLVIAIYLRVENKNKMPLIAYLFAIAIWPLILITEISF
jgi:hypothetical protein